jgi:hypothetical protein
VRFPDSIQQQITEENRRLYNQEGSRYSANNPDNKIRVRYHADELYPGYFDSDQLYNLKTDPDEQVNLAYREEYRDSLTAMKKLLAKKIQDFPHNFGEFK